MKKEVLDQFNKPFNVKERSGPGGKKYKYVASEDVMSRMTEATNGQWTSRVIDTKVVDDNILVHVRVEVFDDTNSQYFSQEGFASHPVFKFTSGPNQGKIIDVGNSYKSAMSKAIKTACSRWGVALNLEESDEFADNIPEMPAPKSSSGFPYSKPASSQTKSDFPDFTGPSTPVPTSPPMQQPQSALKPSGVDDFPFDMPSVPLAGSNKPTSNSGANNIGSIPMNNEGSAAPELPEINLRKLTDVQKASIEHILSIQGVSFRELVMGALGVSENEGPTSIDELTYKDAISLISHGNLSLRGSNK